MSLEGPVVSRQFSDAATESQNSKAYYAEHGLLSGRAAQERDACGFGLILSKNGPSHAVIASALTALGNMAHRGVTMDDGLTGDGAGIRLQIPADFVTFVRRRAQSEGFALPAAVENAERVAAGQFFFKPDADAELKQVAEQRIRAYLVEQGYGENDFAWCTVPVDTAYLGEDARKSQPNFEQLILPVGATGPETEFGLYKLRLQIEQDWRNAGYNQKNSEAAYICSLSADGLVYKGMPTAENVANLYPDLRDPAFQNISWAQVHQRMSTNTTSTADKAHPYRLVVHNGEINTLTANKIFGSGAARERIRSVLGDEGIDSIFQPGGSDTAAFDNYLEFLVMMGMSLPTALSVMIADANGIDPENHKTVLDAGRDITLPWDGPVAMAAVANGWAVALRDRNGFRPARGLETNDGLIIIGSEIGMVPVEPQDIARYLPLGPGQKFAVNFATGEFLDAAAVEALAAVELESTAERVRVREAAFTFTRTVPDYDPLENAGRAELFHAQARAHYTDEGLKRVLRPLAMDSQEATWSMGDDAQPAFLSEGIALDPMYGMMRQAFAQVTNPPMDSVNEGARMQTLDEHGGVSLNMSIGDLGAPLPSPILFTSELEQIEKHHADRFARIDISYDPAGGEGALRDAMARVLGEVDTLVAEGKTQFILSHANADGVNRLPISMPLAVSAVHNRLVDSGLRNRMAIHAHTQELIETHKTSMLIAAGANFVTPYLVERTIADQLHAGAYENLSSVVQVLGHYRNGVDKGFKKIIAKMGISVPSAFWGQFSLLGVDEKDAAEFFPGIASPIGGLTLEHIQERQVRHAALASEVIDDAEARDTYRLASGSAYANQEPQSLVEEELREIHTWSPAVINALQLAAKTNLPQHYAKLTELLREQRRRDPINIRDLLTVKKTGGIALDEVEGVTAILDRMNAPGISYGAIGGKAHGSIATAMNHLRAQSETGHGPKSNSGEGGESVIVRRLQGASSAIKQIASGRFGVDAFYLADADVIEIKVAQGAKPGEGGQLEGVKVAGFVAELRRSTPGVGLVSPPPHHDIYSIEDLTQLIADLKAVNPKARVRVKLVSQPGIGQIAVGVAKARADEIHVAGHSGGTGASPQSSVKGAGNPVEIGLAEVHQALKANNLRGTIRLVADGGVIDGSDMVKLMMLGADEVGIGTAGLVALGCIMLRKCHLNICAAGVATQDPIIEAKFGGQAVFLENYYRHIAEDARGWMARLGVAKSADLVGRSDLLEQTANAAGANLSRLLALDPSETHKGGARAPDGTRNEPPQTLDEKLGAKNIIARIFGGEKVAFDADINATNLSVGARFAYEIVDQFMFNAIDMLKDSIRRDEKGECEPEQLAEAAAMIREMWPKADALTINFKGNAGQSFGAFTVDGMNLKVEGSANDYVGKGMRGGRLVVRPAADSIMAAATDQFEIAGNTLLYGATGGEAFIAGRVNERFMVRGSGARSVVEGCGDFGCEYMSGGVAVILGRTGQSFATGMKGGLAFVYDEDGTAETRVNKSGTRILKFSDNEFHKIGSDSIAMAVELKKLVTTHLEETGSTKAASILADWDKAKYNFKLVVSKELIDLGGDGGMGREYRVNAMKFFEGLAAAAKLDEPRFAA